MNGKDKCKILKQIRRDIAERNDISLTIAECHHKGNCKGTCPRCEAEVAALERALEARRKSGRTVVLAGISAGLIAASCVSCSPLDPTTTDELAGDVPATEETTVEDTTIEGTMVIEGMMVAPEEETK